MADTQSTLSAILKEYYTKDRINYLLYKDNPFYRLVKKETDGAGLPYFRVPLVISPSGMTSANFSNAQTGAKATATGAREFRVDRLSTYSLNFVDDVVVLASRGGAAAFLEASKNTVENTIYRLARDISICMYRSGYGDRGQISTTAGSVTGTVITLSTASDSSNFELGDRLVVTDTLGNAAKALGSSGNPLIVTGIDRDAGTLTFAFAVNDATNGVPTIAQGDFIGMQGDIVAAKSKLTGLAGYLPESAPTTGDDFFGLDRSIDAQRLAGVRVDGTSMTVIEALNAGAVQVAKVGGKTTHFLVSFNTFQDIVNSYQGVKRIIDHDKNEPIGFQGFEVVTPRGVAEVIPDINCPDNAIFGLQLDTWKVLSLGDTMYQVGSDFGDGLMFFRSFDTDQWELRYRFTGALTCNAPGWNCVISR